MLCYEIAMFSVFCAFSVYDYVRQTPKFGTCYSMLKIYLG